MSLFKISDITDIEYDEEHFCPENTFPKLDRLLHCVCSHGEDQNTWHLHNIHYAEKKEVEMGEAESEGEITSHSIILVNYCPFCGVKLSSNE